MIPPESLPEKMKFDICVAAGVPVVSSSTYNPDTDSTVITWKTAVPCAITIIAGKYHVIMQTQPHP